MRKEEAVANFFIMLGNGENEDYMTNLRLNKLMYFAQAWNLVLFGKPLFHEEIQAWQLGPVVPSIYHKYKYKGKDQITDADSSFKVNMLSENERQLVLSVMACYGIYSTSGLVDISHIPGSPWDEAIKTGRETIDPERIRNYFCGEKPIKLFGSGDDHPTVGYHDSQGRYVLPTDWK